MDNKKKCLLSTKYVIRMISEGSGNIKNVLIISKFWLVSIIIIIQETIEFRNPYY